MEITTPYTINHLKGLLRLGNYQAVAEQYLQLNLDDFDTSDQIELWMLALECRVFDVGSEEHATLCRQLEEAELSLAQRCLLQADQASNICTQSRYIEAQELIDKTRQMLPEPGWVRDMIRSRLFYTESTILDRAGKPVEGHEALLEVLRISEQYFDKMPRDTVRALLSLGGSSINVGKLDEAEAYFAAVKAKTAESGLQDITLSINANFFHSRLLNSLNQDYKAIELLQEAEDMLRSAARKYDKLEGLLYLLFAVSLAKIEDHYEALYYGRRSFQIQEQNPTEHYRSVCEQLTVIHLALGNDEKARNYAQKIIDFYVERNGEKPNPHLAMAYSIIGLSHREKPEVGSEWQLKALEVLHRLGMKHEDGIIFFYFPYQRLVLINSGEEKLKHAKEFVRIAEEGYTHLPATVAEAYLLLGESYLELGKQEEAYAAEAKSMEITAKSVSKDGNQDYAQNLIFYQCLTIQCKALLEKYRKSNDKASLDLATKTQYLAAERVHMIRSNFKDEKSKSFFNDSKVMQGQAVAIEILLEGNRLTGENPANDILQIISLNKSSNLYSQISESSAREKLADEPKIRKLEELNKEVVALKNSYAIEGHSEARYAAYFEKRNERQHLLQEIETAFPEYGALKYQMDTLDLPELQKILGEDQIVLNYFMVEQVLYTVVVKQDETEVVRIELPKDFRQLVQDFSNAINWLNETDVLSISRRLYELLINPVADLLFDIFDEGLVKPLVIIPHDCLFNVPFESLRNEEEELLLQQFDISYHYSTSIWLRQKQQARKDSSKQPRFLGIAPVYLAEAAERKNVTDNAANLPDENDRALITAAEQEEWASLPFSESEVLAIAESFDSKGGESQNLLHESANKSAVLAGLPDADYIHFAAHFHQHPVARLSGLILSGADKLYLQEAKNLHLKARLVVLSACESAVGELESSEGMLAITREFLSSGASNVISTLFKVQDKIACELMISFYQNVLSGQSISASLANAKRSLLSENPAVPTKLWSAFVLTGE